MRIHAWQAVAVALCFTGCARDGGDDGDDERQEALDTAPPPLTFMRACEPGATTTIAAVGDILLHEPLQRQAYALGFPSLWAGIADLLREPDVLYGNHEGVTAAGVTLAGAVVPDPGPVYDGVVHTGTPKVNVHVSEDVALARAGFNVVSTANNHALDRGAIGVDRTLDSLDAARLVHSGTRRVGSTGRWSGLTSSAGFNIRWLACTYGTNVLDERGQALRCFVDADKIEGYIRTLAAAPGIDAVIVTPHWGIQQNTTQGPSATALAHRFLDAGATAVLGAHPHVLQGWEKYVTRDGRETFVMYSLGNFVSGHSALLNRTTVLLYLGLTRGADGRSVINGVRYMPLYMSHDNDRYTIASIDRAGGPADARAFTTSKYGDANVRLPGEPLVTNPQCAR